jgi:nucleotidyltransferase substrate binding protein (TIGR01987 family)
MTKMVNLDERWHQRLKNFQKALIQLEEGIVLSRQRKLSKIELQGLIQAFEFTHELAWNVMKDFFHYQGNTSIMGSRDATRESFQYGLIEDGDAWMEMIKSRNQSTHTYNESIVLEITGKIVTVYYSLFKSFEKKMLEIKNAN